MHGEYNIIYLIIFRGELGILTYNKCPPFNYLHILKGTVSRILRIQRLAYVPVPTVFRVWRGGDRRRQRYAQQTARCRRYRSSSLSIVRQVLWKACCFNWGWMAPIGWGLEGWWAGSFSWTLKKWYRGGEESQRENVKWLATEMNVWIALDSHPRAPQWIRNKQVSSRWGKKTKSKALNVLDSKVISWLSEFSRCAW